MAVRKRRQPARLGTPRDDSQRADHSDQFEEKPGARGHTSGDSVPTAPKKR